MADQEENEWLESELQKELKESTNLIKNTSVEMLKDATVWKLALIYFANLRACSDCLSGCRRLLKIYLRKVLQT